MFDWYQHQKIKLAFLDFLIITYLDLFKTISFFYNDKTKLDFILGYLPFIFGYGIFVQNLFWDIWKIHSGIRDIWGHLLWDTGYHPLNKRSKYKLQNS